MLKKFLLTMSFLSVFFMSTNVFAFAHKLTSNWYKEEIAGTKKEKITTITFEENTFDKTHTNKIYWELDNDGLVAYMEDDTNVVIAIPEGNTLETAFNANDLFAFYKIREIDREHYETGDYGMKIYGVQPDDGSFPVPPPSKYESDLEQINNLYLLNTYSTEHFDEFFMGLKSLTTLDLSSMNTTFAKSFSKMFMGCENLKSIDISNFDTENIEDMSSMFRDCKRLTDIKFGKLKTDNLKDMHSMFENCKWLKSINLNDFNTKNVTDMSSLFKNCTNLESLTIDKIDTSEVRDTSSMFDNCQKLKVIDVSHFNTKCINRCEGMFMDCGNLEAIDLSNFNFNGNVNVENMLVGCNSLKAIVISDSICQRFDNMRLEGKWQNVTTKKVYNFDDANYEKPIAGGYIKI